MTPASGAGDQALPATAPVGIADGVERRLDPKVVVTWRIGAAIAAAFFSAGALIATLVLMLKLDAAPWFRFAVLPALWLLLLALLLAWALAWPGVRYRHTSYRVMPASLEIRHGAVWRNVAHVPKNRVQHTDVKQGPIERAFGLATLIVYTAGTEYASVPLGGLPRETAFRIRDHLLPGVGDDAV